MSSESCNMTGIKMRRKIFTVNNEEEAAEKSTASCGTVVPSNEKSGHKEQHLKVPIIRGSTSVCQHSFSSLPPQFVM